MGNSSPRYPFLHTGRLLGFIFKKDGQIKQLRLATAQGELTLKVAKFLRPTLTQILQPGDWIQVQGEAKGHAIAAKPEDVADSSLTHVGAAPTTRLKVTQIQRMNTADLQGLVPAATGEMVPILPTPPMAKSATILMCQKSSCMKRGGKAVCHALSEALAHRPDGDRITIQGTGCMKHCQAGPIVVMPDKTRHTKVKAKAVAAIVAAHCPPAPSRPRRKPRGILTLAS